MLDQPILVGDLGELFNIKCHDEVIYKNRADHLYQLGEYEEAVENYNQAIAQVLRKRSWGGGYCGAIALDL